MALLSLIESLSAAAGVSSKEIEGFCFALSGVSRKEDFKRIEELLRRHMLHKRSRVIPDFEAALLGGTRGEAGLVVISGTGSVVFGRSKSGKTKKVLGHGHLIGDPGSGYDLGIRGLRAILAAGEERGEKTKLGGRILDDLSLRNQEEIVPWLYSVEDAKQATARLAPTVLSAAEGGDKVAEGIVRTCAGELVDVAVFTAEHLGLTGERFDVVLSGGVLENNPGYFRLMETMVSERISGANPIRPEKEPAFGALVALLGRPESLPTEPSEADAGGQEECGPAR
jgi:N-acetylglucosamine kinase-like BadF-type ATPase